MVLLGLVLIVLLGDLRLLVLSLAAVLHLLLGLLVALGLFILLGFVIHLLLGGLAFRFLALFISSLGFTVLLGLACLFTTGLALFLLVLGALLLLLILDLLNDFLLGIELSAEHFDGNLLAALLGLFNSVKYLVLDAEARFVVLVVVDVGHWVLDQLLETHHHLLVVGLAVVLRVLGADALPDGLARAASALVV